MGYQDRDYSRNVNGGWSPITWLLTGSVPLFNIFGIQVRAHASLIVVILLTLVLGFGTPQLVPADRFVFVVFLFAIVLLHELGHCFGARIMGGDAHEITLSPLGGLAHTMAPRRPLATFVTVAAGPMVNVLLMAGSAIALYALGGGPKWSFWGFSPGYSFDDWNNVRWYLAWFFRINYLLLLFNLLPIYPLDGGQLLQSALWRPLGYFRSMMVTMNIAVFGGGAVALYFLAFGRTLAFVITVNSIINAYRIRAQLKQAGPWAFSEEEEDYSAAQWKPSRVESRSSRRADDRAERRQASAAAAEVAEQRKIDRILEKVHHHGMHSLTFLEKRALKVATEKQRQRNLQGRR